MTSPLEGLTDEQLRKVLNVGSAFAALQMAADVVERAHFDDDDVEAIGWLPAGLRMHTVARVIDAAEGIREELREIDARILLLTAGAPA
jgi:hypothetical protein